jgi:hypothetical protein
MNTTMITPKQQEALRKIDNLFGQLEKRAETTGVKPDQIAELLTFSNIDLSDIQPPSVQSLSSSRRDVFESYLKSKVRNSAL